MRLRTVEISARTILLWREVPTSSMVLGQTAQLASKFTTRKFLHVHMRTYGLSRCESLTSAHTILLWRAYTDSVLVRHHSSPGKAPCQ
jgi:hypothetical protein